MKSLLIVFTMLLLLQGCATRAYVRQECERSRNDTNDDLENYSFYYSNGLFQLRMDYLLLLDYFNLKLVEDKTITNHIEEKTIKDRLENIK